MTLYLTDRFHYNVVIETLKALSNAKYFMASTPKAQITMRPRK
jgi:hypothetical protein